MTGRLRRNPQLDLLPYSKLFAPDTIGDYLGIKWTDGSAFLLTWSGPDTTPITSEFLEIYRKRLASFCVETQKRQQERCFAGVGGASFC